ncbi:hypothetical protein [Halosimplex sp. TS25]|uniref:hypothetical protein n=1 Tax=Halosimplex rarum TaxID=3396619 RepID=UPI0039E839D7
MPTDPNARVSHGIREQFDDGSDGNIRVRAYLVNYPVPKCYILVESITNGAFPLADMVGKLRTREIGHERGVNAGVVAR